MTIDTRKRVKWGSLGLVSTVLVLFLWSICIPRAEGQVQTNSQHMVQATVWNQDAVPLMVRIANDQGKVLVQEQKVPAQGLVSFSVDKTVCRRTIQAWVNGRHYKSIRGHLCPSSYPDETMTVVVLDTRMPQIVGEDRD